MARYWSIMRRPELGAANTKARSAVQGRRRETATGPNSVSHTVRVTAGRAAGFHTICVTYGYHRGEEIRATKPDALAESFADVPDIVSLFN